MRLHPRRRRQQPPPPPTAIIDDHAFENDIAMDCDNNEANENMIVDEEDVIYSPEKNLLFTFNFQY